MILRRNVKWTCKRAGSLEKANFLTASPDMHFQNEAASCNNNFMNFFVFSLPVIAICTEPDVNK